MSDTKNRLLKMLVEKSFNYSEKPTFKLHSGAMSSYYINCKTTTLNPEGMRLIGTLLFENFIRGKDIQAAGGLTLGADPISFSVAMASFDKKEPVRPFVVRKTPKGHGLKQWIEGEIHKGDRVVILDDVVTTGESTIHAIRRAKEAGLNVQFALCLVDREEGGRDTISKENTQLLSLFTKTDLLNHHKSGLRPQT